MQLNLNIAAALSGTALALTGTSATAAVLNLEPVAAGGLRSFDDASNTPLVLNFFQFVDQTSTGVGPLIDRGILEFDLSNVEAQPNQTANLKIELVSGGDLQPPNGQIDVFAYQGNGVVDLSDVDSGTLISSFEGPPGRAKTKIQFSVNSVVQAALNSNQSYLGLRFSTPNADNYTSFFQREFGSDTVPPVLEIVPEPSVYGGVVVAMVGLLLHPLYKSIRSSQFAVRNSRKNF